MYLSVDFETFSTVDLRKTGVYPYAASPDTGVLCMSYAFGDSPVRTWVPSRDEPFPGNVADWVAAGKPLRAWNANFERVVWALVLGPRGIPIGSRTQWFDTMADAAALSLPQSLARCADALGMPEKKDVEGNRLMRQMCKPRKGGGWWHEDPERGEEKLDRLIRYCEQDVRTEREIHAAIPELGPRERRVYVLDQTINDRGVEVDTELVRAARKIVKIETARANKEVAKLTAGDVTAVTKVADMKAWLNVQGADIDNLRKDTIRDLLEDEDFPDDVRRVIELRAEVAKTSTAKLKSMEAYAGAYNRARGMLQYHGASTGRWSGRGPQPQNYPRPEIRDPEALIPAVLAADTDAISEVAPPLVAVASMLRSMLRASKGRTFVSGDFSQIEARVTAWFAGQDDLLETFAGDGRVYERMASVIYGIHPDEIGKDSKERQIGKMTILGAGFGMGWETFIKQTKKMTGIVLTEAESRHAVDTFREKNHKIQQFWYDIESAAMHAIREPGRQTSVGGGKIRFKVAGQFLWARLPSGRKLAYAIPRVELKMKPWGKPGDTISFMGINSYTRKWTRLDAYGGLLTENVVQAHARDLMATAMLRVDPEFPVVLTVHDEILSEVRADRADLDRFLELMRAVPSWSAGVPIEVEGWVGDRYRK